MKNNVPSPPGPGTALPSSHPSEDTLQLLSLRRSTTAALLSEPGPSPEQLFILLRIAARVPDHRRVVPYRFIVFEKEARDALGDIFEDAARKSNNENVPQADIAHGLAKRAPLIIAVISAVNTEHKTPVWEQILTAGAVCQNMLLAASAMGYAGQWLSEWMAYDENVHRGLELKPDEKIAGFLYFGAATEEPKERVRPDMGEIIQLWPTR